MPNTRRNSHDDSDSTTSTRSRNGAARGGSRRRSHSITAEANRHVIQPARRMMRSSTRKVKRQISTLPAWLPWAAAGVGIAALIYAVAQMESVQDFIGDMVDSFGDSDDFEDDDMEYGSSNGSADHSSSSYGNADYGSTGAGGL